MKIKFNKWHAFLIWLFGALGAIAFIGDSLLLGVGIALASGVIFGLLLWRVARGDSAKNGRYKNEAVLDPKRNFK